MWITCGVLVENENMQNRAISGIGKWRFSQIAYIYAIPTPAQVGLYRNSTVSICQFDR